MDEYIGIVKLFAGTFAPKGWAFCNGQLMSIAQNSALYSILGTTYGGDGQTTFGLPNLAGRVAVGAGNGQGTPPVQSGEMAGTSSVTLTTQQMPAHTHLQNAATQAATAAAPASTMVPAMPNGVTATTEEAVNVNGYIAAQGATLTPLAPTAIGIAGSNQPFSVMQPYLGMNYIICLEGVYPSRS
jgi:microcystin-dependent protein